MEAALSLVQDWSFAGIAGDARFPESAAMGANQPSSQPDTAAAASTTPRDSTARPSSLDRAGEGFAKHEVAAQAPAHTSWFYDLINQERAGH